MHLRELSDYLQIIISKEEILEMDLSPTLISLNKLIKSKETIEHFHQRIDIGISGYDTDERELFEIIEVRNYLQQLDSKFPYWFYFLNNIHSSSLHLITFSCINCKVENGKKHCEETSMQNFFDAHFGFMNQICDYIDMTDKDNELLTEKILSHF